MKEDLILRKLIADGEGIGEEKRILAVNNFFRDARNSDEFKTAEAVKIMRALDNLEFAMLKQKQIAVMNNEQSEDFKILADNVDQEIEATHQKMEEAKKELADARIVKSNRQEYSKIVKTIEEVPSRTETTRKLCEVKDELERQLERQKVLEAKLIDRKNQFQAFNVILANFQQFIIDDDDNNAEDEENDDSGDKQESERDSKKSEEPADTGNKESV